MSRLTYDDDGHVYRLDGTRLKSVSTIAKQAGPDFTNWAAKLCAEYAVDHWEDLSIQTPAVRRQEISSAHRASRDRKAAAGTAIHTMAEQLLAGDAVEVPPSMVGKVEGLAKWIELAGITVLHSEQMVWTAPDDEYGLPGYAGRFDAIVQDPRRGVGLLDWKTGSGIYGNMGVQLAGYRDADWMVDGDEDAYMLEVDWLGAVHVQVGFSDLHTLSDGEADAAAERWRVLRRLSATRDPKFRIEVTG
jgi:hypothetical protein